MPISGPVQRARSEGENVMFYSTGGYQGEDAPIQDGCDPFHCTDALGGEHAATCDPETARDADIDAYARAQSAVAFATAYVLSLPSAAECE